MCHLYHVCLIFSLNQFTFFFCLNILKGHLRSELLIYTTQNNLKCILLNQRIRPKRLHMVRLSLIYKGITIGRKTDQWLPVGLEGGKKDCLQRGSRKEFLRQWTLLYGTAVADTLYTCIHMIHAFVKTNRTIHYKKYIHCMKKNTKFHPGCSGKDGTANCGKWI